MKDLNEIWLRVKDGDEQAFKELFRNMSTQLCSFACRLIHDKEKSEEIIHDVFLKLWNAKAEIEIKRNLKSYLYKAVHNAAVNWLINKKTIKKGTEIMVDDVIWANITRTLDCDTFLIESIESAETEKIIFKAVAELPEQSRKIFRLSRFELKTVKEISDIMGISPSTVKTQLYRALDKIQIILRYNK